MADELTFLGSKIGIDKNEYINLTDIAQGQREVLPDSKAAQRLIDKTTK